MAQSYKDFVAGLTDEEVQELMNDPKLFEQVRQQLQPISQPNLPLQAATTGVKAAIAPFNKIVGDVSRINEGVGRGLGALGQIPGSMISGYSPEQALNRAVPVVQGSKPEGSTWPEAVGRFTGRLGEPFNMVGSELLKGPITGMGEYAAGMIAPKGAEAEAAGLFREPFRTNLLTPEAAKGAIAATRNEITGLTGEIDALTVIDPVVQALVSKASQTEGTIAPLKALLADLNKATNEAGKISATRAQELLAGFASHKAGYGSELTKTGKILLQDVKEAAQSNLNREVPGLEGVNLKFAGQYRADPFENVFPDINTVKPTKMIPPRLTGLGIQGAGIAGQLLTHPTIGSPLRATLAQLLRGLTPPTEIPAPTNSLRENLLKAFSQ